MPTGRLREGRAKVAGVTSEDALAALRKFQKERGLPTLSRALGVVLEEWHSAAAQGVLPHGRGARGRATGPSAGRVLPAPDAPGEAFPSAVRIVGLKEFARDRLPPDHPLREVLLAEEDILTPEEFLAKLTVWCVLVNRKS